VPRDEGMVLAERVQGARVTRVDKGHSLSEKCMQSAHMGGYRRGGHLCSLC